MAEENGNNDGATDGGGNGDAGDGSGTDTGQQNPNSQATVPPEMKRALAKANKEAETLRLKLKEFEDRDKTEAQKLQERAEAAEKAAADNAAQLLRFQVAAAKGLPAELAARLQGADEKELAADADKLLALVGAPPNPKFNGGPRSTPDAKPDMNSLIRQAAGHG